MFGRPSKNTRQRGIFSQRRAQGQRRPAASRRLRVEPLESRLMLHAEGLAWFGGEDLTISFAPDGTEVAGQTSELFANFQSLQNFGWQKAVLNAFRTWAQYTSTDVKLVADGGDPLGVAGLTRGDSRFGDVRIAAVPLSSDVIAISVPHDEYISGTWAGDVLINSNAHFANVDDFFSVMLHEAGHVFGLGHSDDPDSPMYSHGVSMSGTLTDQDIADLRHAMGMPVQRGEGSEVPRDDEAGYQGEGEPGEVEGEVGWSLVRSARWARDVQYVAADVDRSGHFVSSGVISSASDVDTFRLSAGDRDADHLAFLTVTVRSTEPGGELPRVEIFSTSGAKLDAQVLNNSNGSLVLQLADMSPRNSYIVRVSDGDSTEPFESSSYQLEARFADHQTQLEQIAAATLGGTDPQHIQQSLHVEETALVHFVLTAAPGQTDAAAGVRAVLYDPAGVVVGRFTVQAGEPSSSSTLLLARGDYRLEVTAQPDAGTSPEVAFELLGAPISLPIGPGISDPTRIPILPSPHPQVGPGTDPLPDLVVTNPIIFPDPIYIPNPPLPILVNPPWVDFTRWPWGSVAVDGVWGRVSP